MKKIIINEKEINVCEEITEVTIDGYHKLLDLYQLQDDLIDEQFVQKFIPVISSLTEKEVGNLYEEDLPIFLEAITKFSPQNFSPIQQKVFEFSGVKYTYVIPDRLTFGETVSLKLLNKGKPEYEALINLLTVLVRPGIEKQNEFGETYYVPIEFDGDMEILNRRKEMFKTIPAVNALWIIQAFTAGRKK